MYRAFRRIPLPEVTGNKAVELTVGDTHPIEPHSRGVDDGREAGRQADGQRQGQYGDARVGRSSTSSEGEKTAKIAARRQPARSPTPGEEIAGSASTADGSETSSLPTMPWSPSRKPLTHAEKTAMAETTEARLRRTPCRVQLTTLEHVVFPRETLHQNDGVMTIPCR